MSDESDKFRISDAPASRDTVHHMASHAGMTIGVIAVLTASLLILTSLSLIGSELLRILWVASGLIAALYFALGSHRTRTLNAQKAVLVLWGFLLMSEGFFPRDNVADSAFAGSFSVAAYGEAIIWVVSFLILIQLILGSPLPIQRLFSGHYKWVVAFGVVCLGSCIYSPRPLFAVAWAFKLGLVILLLHVCSAYMRELDDIDSFLRITFWALAFLILVWVVQGDGAHSFFDEQGRLVRSNGISASAGTLFLLSLTLYSRFRGIGLKKGAIVVGSMAFLAMVVGGGKAGIVAGLIAGVVFFMLRRGFGSAAMFVVGAFVVGSLAIMLSPMSGYLQNYVQDDELATLTGRTPLWQAVLPEIWKRPILGYGYVASTFVSVQIDGIPWEAGHMHNGFLEALYNDGLIGLVLIVAIHVIIVRNLWRAIGHSSPAEYSYQLGIGCLAIYVNLLINGLANASFGGRAWHPFMLLLALVVVSGRLAETVLPRGPKLALPETDAVWTEIASKQEISRT